MRVDDLPLVSICVPTYNGERYLGEALESALAQTYPRLELVLSDDASADQTLQIAERVLATAPFPVTVVHHAPAGIAANWNNCVRAARGEYVKFLFQDDVLRSDCVERMVQLAQRDERVGLVYCRRRVLVDAADPIQVGWVRRQGVLHQSWDRLEVTEGIRSGRDYLKDPALMRLPKNKIGEPTAVLLKRSTFAREGYFDETVAHELDYLQWYKIMRHHHVGFVDDDLVTFRLHPGQATWQNKQSGRFMDHTRYRRYFLRHYLRYLHPSVQTTLVGREMRARVLQTGMGQAVARPIKRWRRWVGGVRRP